MAFSSLIKDYVGNGLAAARPVTPNVAGGVSPFYYATDTATLSFWTGTAWQNVAGASIAVQDEGSTLTSALALLNFTGAGVTATNVGPNVTVNIPGGGGGGGAWTLASSTTISSPVAQVDVTGLAGAGDILVSARNVTASVSSLRAIRFSTDNGASFFSGAANYTEISALGAETGFSAVGLQNTANTGPLSGVFRINGANTTGGSKVYESFNRANSGIFTGSTDPINAIRIYNFSGGNLTGGVIQVWTR